MLLGNSFVSTQHQNHRLATWSYCNALALWSGVFSADQHGPCWGKIWWESVRVEIADPSSRQRGRPKDTRSQISDSNIPTGNNTWSQVPKGWSIPRHTDWLTVSSKVTSTSISTSGRVEVEVTLQLTVDRSVSQYVKVSSPLWDLWPDITFCPKAVFWNLSCLCGAPSLTRGRVCHLSFWV
jgi:hypothetical protein